MDSIIPENRQGAVRKALQTAFGVNEFDDIKQLTKGLSGALVFKIIVSGKAFLLRIITLATTRDKPENYFHCMRTAADAGLAPEIFYLDIEERISITGFITAKPFSLPHAKIKMADTIRRLHELPAFPQRINYIDVADSFFQKFEASNILPDRITNDVFMLYKRIGKVYPQYDQANLVSCHNDLKPDNIIFDGVLPWLVDWEAAFLNDRYADLAAIANFVVRSEQDEVDFLERYFGQALDEYKHARFFLMSQIIHMFCFTLCMTTAAGKFVDTTINTPGFRKFHDRLWDGEIDLGNKTEKIQYALVHFEQLRDNLHSERFEKSLQIVSDHASI